MSQGISLSEKPLNAKPRRSFWLRIFIILILLFGIFFRLINLDQKVYWYDETFTSLRISGYTEKEAIGQVYTGREISPNDLQKYQHPNSEKSLIDTLKGLALEEPQQSPLYFILVRFWVQLFGSSVAGTRSLSVFLSLLAFPCLYWLCRELFNSSLTGWISVALISVSLFHVVYAQEARPYTMWTVTILLSSAALLRAMRLKTKSSWIIYAATIILSFYTYLFSIFVVISHGVYVLATERLRWNKTVIAYLITALAGLLCFSPWLAIIMINLRTIQYRTEGSRNPTSLLDLMKGWCGNIKLFFIHIGSAPYVTIVCLILVGYALYFLWRHTVQSVWLFPFTLIVVPALAIILPDLILGGRRSTAAKYLIPCFLGMQLAVAHLLASGIVSANSSKQKIWRVIMTVLITGGIASCAINAQSESSLSKIFNGDNPQIARLINQSAHPVIISDTSDLGNFGSILSLSYLVNSNLRFLLIVKPESLKIPDHFSDLFLYDTSGKSEALRNVIRKNYKIQLIHENEGMRNLWRLEKSDRE